MSTRILEKFNSSSRYLYNEIQVRNYKKKKGPFDENIECLDLKEDGRKLRFLGIGGTFSRPIRDHRAKQPIHFTSPAVLLCEWCADSVFFSPKPSFPRHEHRLRDSPSKKSVEDQAVEDGSSWKYRSVDWKRFSHGKFRRGLDCISRNNRHQSRHEFLFLRNQIWRTIRWQIRLRDRMMRSLFKG